MTLTRRQRAIVDLLRQRVQQQADPPTLSELCQLLGLRSRGSLHKQVQALVDAGLVEPMNRQHRGVRLVSTPLEAEAESGLAALPLLGKIAARRPIESIPDPRHVEVPSHLRRRRPCYVLQVEGDSMCEAGILDGDQVVIEAREHADDGEIVVALIRGEEVTLKRLLQQPERVILYPENSAMEAMEYHPDEVQIQGVLVGLMRPYGP
jgi:repressor LexA